jgi:hypothetical protein
MSSGDVVMTEAEFLAIYETFVFHYAEGVTLESTEDYVEAMRIEEQGHKTIQKVHDRHFGE